MYPISARTCLSILAAVLISTITAHSQQNAKPRSPAPPDAKAYFIGLNDGDTIPANVIIRFGVTKMEIAPTTVKTGGTGHHHLLIDTSLPPLDRPIPSDFNHIHFGKGQTEVELALTPGEHTVQLLLGDSDHIPHNPPVMSEVIHVRVDPATVQKPRTPAPSNASAFFVDLVDGATLPRRATVKFGLAGMELAPSGSNKPNSGHHHLLIDTPLPPLDREIPSDFNHLHFGRAQTEVELSLTPGAHTLQLLLGDYEHVPHDPPIMSKPIRVFVVDTPISEPAPAVGGWVRKSSPPDAAVYFIYPHNGDVIFPKSTIRFGLRNMGVAPAGVLKPNTGHHHLLIDVDTPPLDKEIPSDLNHIHLGGGQTEKKITLKPGEHTLQLVFADEKHIPHDPPVISEHIKVIVKAARKKPRIARHGHAAWQGGWR